LTGSELNITSYITGTPPKKSIVSQTRYLSLTGSEIAIIQNLVSGTEKSSIFRSKTLTPKNKNLNFQNFLSPL